MKKAFSLIEIMQTVVLLGIIAGLSISFFKKINSDQKLYLATQSQLTSAIRQVERNMCTDTTPLCTLTDNNGHQYVVKFDDLKSMDFTENGFRYDNVWDCAYIYGNNATLSASGNCEYTPAGAAPCRVQAGAAGAPDVLFTINAPAGHRYPPMVKNQDGNCFAPPPCPNNTNTDINGVDTWEAIPMNRYICPNNVPQYSQLITYIATNGVTSYRAFCMYFHDAVAHKPQGVDADADLDKTCGVGSTIFDNDNCRAAGVLEYAILPGANITDSIARIDTGSCPEAAKDNYNMLLPNGVYLYNLRSGPDDIIVKYDRMPEVSTAKYEANQPKQTTVRVYSYNKAINQGGNGEVTKLSDLDAATWRGRTDEDKENCPNGGTYDGIDEQTQKPKCKFRSNDDIQKCQYGGNYSDGQCVTSGSGNNGSQGTSTQTGGDGPSNQQSGTNTQQNDGPSTVQQTGQN